MPLLLTILSVLAVWVFLAVLAVGLLLVLKALQGVRGYMRKITVGVRAIEKQTEPLETRATTVIRSFGETADAVSAAAEGLRRTVPALVRAEAQVRRR
jgi:uncharacterized protein YoxC